MKATQAAVTSFMKSYRDKKSDHIEWFDGKGGFGLRARRNAEGKVHWSYTYQYKIGGLNYRMTLGNAANLPLASALEAYQAHLGDKAKGRNPATDIQAERAKQREKAAAKRAEKAMKTLSEHIDDYLEVKEADTKPRSYLEIKRLLTKDYFKPLHGLALKQITQEMVSGCLRTTIKHNGTTAAGHARIALSTFFRWAIGEGFCVDNPVKGTNRPKSAPARDRVLTDEELAAVWKSAPDNDYGKIVRLLILTGQRRDEIGSLRWSEINAGEKTLTLPVERLKNGNRDGAKPHDVPLSADALAILEGITRRTGRDIIFGDGKGGFSGWSKAKEALDEASGVTDWRLHDLRRTAATRMADSGVAPHVIEMVQNHVSGFLAGVAGVYNRAKYIAEKRAALDTLASYVRTVVAASESGNVRRFSRKAG